MGNNISKASDAALARVTFKLQKAGIRFSYKDHLAIDLLHEDGTMAQHILSMQLSEEDLAQLPSLIEKMILSQPKAEDNSAEEFMLQYRERLAAQAVGSKRLSTLHILRDIVADTSTATSHLLSQYGITAQSLDNAIDEMTDFEPVAIPRTPFRQQHIAEATPDVRRSEVRMIDRFGCDLTRLAREGGIDPVVGRDKEIERVIQILLRRKKNNPLLIGEAGVGKSAIVEGLALRIAAGNVPHALLNRRLFSLDIAAVVAGTKYRGEFEERMQQLLDELQHCGDTIVFIDEIHTISGAGSTQGALDTANILKPALARGQMQTIGATTLDECRQYIESDAALERRFQKLTIHPTSPAATLDILHRIAPKYEQHHNVRYTDEALKACVELSQRYITSRHFPDKAIDLMDEAGAQSQHPADKPERIRNTEQRLQLADEEHKQAIEALAYDKAVTARLKSIALSARLSEEISTWQRERMSNPTTVDRADVERVVTSITGIPAERLSHNEAERLKGLSEHLRRRVVGQDEAIERLARSLRCSRAGLRDDNRPIGVYLFTGPTGVGKTLLAKELSTWINESQRALIRIDMSEYAERHNVARLIGSPPGYIGYGEGGQLTEAVRRQPYAVILFDEVEKAHPDVMNALLQLFDEGYMTDGAGRKVDFRNTIIILTSNVGSRKAAERSVTIGFGTPSKIAGSESQPREEYRKAIEQNFAPELLNRIDDIVCFRSLEIDDIEQIVDLELERLLSRTLRQGCTIEITPAAKRHIASLGHESQYGVRSLKRTIADHIEEPLSAMIIEGEIRSGAKIIVDRLDEQINLRVA